MHDAFLETRGLAQSMHDRVVTSSGGKSIRPKKYFELFEQRLGALISTLHLLADLTNNDQGNTQLNEGTFKRFAMTPHQIVDAQLAASEVDRSRGFNLSHTVVEAKVYKRHLVHRL